MTVSITSGSQIIGEGVGSVKVCVALDHLSLVPVSITVTTVPGTALSEFYEICKQYTS